jgi:hypothetical protein
VDADLDGGGAGGGGDADAGGEVEALDAQGSSSIFRYLSLQSVAAFAMGAGWAGLVAYRSFEWSFGLSTLAAVGGGVGMAYLLIAMIRVILRLQSDGTVSIDSAVGHDGEVTLTVPASAAGRGTVRVVVDGRDREYAAVAAGGEALPTGSRVRVVSVNADRTLVVDRA